MAEETVTLQSVLSDLDKQVAHLEKSMDDSFDQLKTIKKMLAHILKVCDHESVRLTIDKCATSKMCNKEYSNNNKYNINKYNTNMLHTIDKCATSNVRPIDNKCATSKVCDHESVRPTNDKKDASTSIEYMLAQYLFSYIYDRKPNIKKPNIQIWTKHISRMIKLDKREPERIKEVIEWCQQDDFWCDNILSTRKLRDQFDQLELKMDKKKGKVIQTKKSITPDSDDPETTQLLFEEYKRKFAAETDINFDQESMYNIAIGANKVCVYAKKLEKLNIKSKQIIDILLSCLEKNYASEEKIVYPKMLASNNTWNILFPQYLKNCLPSVYSLIKNLNKEKK